VSTKYLNIYQKKERSTVEEDLGEGIQFEYDDTREHMMVPLDDMLSGNALETYIVTYNIHTKTTCFYTGDSNMGHARIRW
jgi:hypothetical protein